MKVKKDMEKTNITEEEILTMRKDYADYMNNLRSACENGIISFDEMEQEKAHMKTKEIIAQHEKNYFVWQGTGRDTRWMTRLPDSKKITRNLSA